MIFIICMGFMQDQNEVGSVSFSDFLWKEKGGFQYS